MIELPVRMGSLAVEEIVSYYLSRNQPDDVGSQLRCYQRLEGDDACSFGIPELRETAVGFAKMKLADGRS